LARRDQPGEHGAEAIQPLLGILGSQSNDLNLEIARRAASWMAVHETEQAEALEALQVELGRARAGTSSRFGEDVLA